MGKGRGHSPCFPPVLLAAWTVPLSLQPHTQFCSPCLKTRGFHAVFCWLRVGMSPCPPVTYSTSVPSVVELAPWHRGWGTQQFYWADFPSGSPCSGWSQHTGALMSAQERRRVQGTLEDAKEKYQWWSVWAAAPKLYPVIQSHSRHIPSSLQGYFYSRWGVKRIWLCQQWVLTILSLLPLEEISSTGARMEQYLLICKLPPFQTAGKERTTSRRQFQLSKERGKQASKADDPCLRVWTKQVPGMHTACFQWLWEPKACFPVSWKWVTCSPVVLRARGKPPHTLLRKKDKKWSEMA